jgi:hypothetical protein
MTVDKKLTNVWEVITSDAASIVAKDNILYAISDSGTVAPTTTTGIPLSGGDMIQIDDGQVLWGRADKWSAEVSIVTGA